jgi:thioredoxin-related protein
MCTMFRKSVLSLAAALALAWLTGPILAGGEKKEGDKEKKTEGDKLWLVDFEKAKEIAAKKNLDIMAEFTGSDWCPPCIRMYENVLSKEAFKETAPKHFVLLKLDSPRDKSKQSDAEIKQYQELSKKFNVTGVPTVFLMDSTGRPYAKMVGYGGQGAEDYTNNLIKKAGVRKERDELFAKAKDAKGVARAKLLAEAIQRIDSELVLTEYRDTVDEIIKLDAGNEAKLKEKYTNLTKLSDINKELNDIQRTARKDAKGAIEKIDALIMKEKLSGEPLQSALFTKGAILFQSDRQAARKTLEQAMQAAPDSERATQIRQILERVFKDKEKDKEKE